MESEFGQNELHVGLDKRGIAWQTLDDVTSWKVMLAYLLSYQPLRYGRTFQAMPSALVLL